MPFSQVKDILNRAVKFHKMLEYFYLKIEDASEKESVKLLVDYMARHEEILKEKLNQINEEQAKQIRDEWLKYEPQNASWECFKDLKIDRDTSVDEVIEMGLELNQCLINLYHQMVEIAPTEDIRTLFLSLELMEIAEKKKLARMRGM